MSNKFGVSDKKFMQLMRKMEELSLSEEDFEESFIKGSGKGGQKVNKTSSCVRLRYPALDIEFKVQTTRNQSLNRFIARKLLCERVEQEKTGELTKKQKQIEKQRKQKARRKRKSAKKYEEEAK